MLWLIISECGKEPDITRFYHQVNTLDVQNEATFADQLYFQQSGQRVQGKMLEFDLGASLREIGSTPPANHKVAERKYAYGVNRRIFAVDSHVCRKQGREEENSFFLKSKIENAYIESTGRTSVN
jgi:hypothetical protein